MVMFDGTYELLEQRINAYGGTYFVIITYQQTSAGYAVKIGERPADTLISLPNTFPKFNTLPDYNLSQPIPPAKYRVIYHLNNDDAVFTEHDRWTVDTNVYSPGTVLSLQNFPDYLISKDGLSVYTFKGWALTPTALNPNWYAGDNITFNVSDLNLYAVWNKEYIATNINGVFTMDLFTDYDPILINIPEFFGGTRVKQIAPYAFKDYSSDIIIPSSVVKLQNNALDGWKGSNIKFEDTPVTVKYPGLTLGQKVFNNNPYLSKVIIPYRCQKLSEGTFYPNSKEVNETFTVYIRNNKDYLANQMDVDSYMLDNHISSGVIVNRYNIEIVWGYND